MASAIRTLVAVDTGIDTRSIEDVLPNDASIQLVGIVEGLDESWRALQDTDVDLLVVACDGYSERALVLIDAARKLDAADRCSCSSEGSSNGFVRRVFEAGADDILMLPQTPDQVAFAIQKVLARRDGAAVAASGWADDLRARAEGRHRQDARRRATSPSRSPRPGKRVALVDLDLQFGDVGLCLGLAPERTIYDLARRRRVARRGEARRLPGRRTRRACRCCSRRAGPTRRARSPSSSCATSTRCCGSTYDFVIVDTPPGFTPEVIASIDASTDLSWSGCSTRSRSRTRSSGSRRSS